MIVILHAYSRRNAGDGLLVDLTFKRLGRGGVRPDDCVLFALDAPSFGNVPHVRQVGMPGRRPSLAMLRSVAQVAAAAGARAMRGNLLLGGLLRELRNASLVVGVGGGYLRTDTMVSAVGTWLNHLPQIASASVFEAPKLYLPQSVGPLPGRVGAHIKRHLREVDVLCVRDDRSVAELSGEQNLHRIPDLAVLDIAERGVTPRGRGTGPVVIVARELGTDPDYHDRLRRLAASFPSAIWAVQTEGIGSKDDGLFYGQLGVRPQGRLVDVLAQHPNSLVVSVRLHGALCALAAGIPAIHLSYQRKGWASYSDLGLNEYVHSARRFDPSLVTQQVALLQEDPTRLWNRLSAQYGKLSEASKELDRLIGRYLTVKR